MLITTELKINNKKILIKDISLHSHKIVKVKCDYCEKIIEKQYNTYNKQTKNGSLPSCCNDVDCMKKKRMFSLQEKYGVNNIFQIKEIKDKIKKTNIKKYGVENPQQNLDIKNKTEETNIKKYGVKNPFQSELIKEKIKETNLEKYGVEYTMQSEYLKQKSKNTSLKNYGFEYPTQNKDFYNKNLKNGFKLTFINELSCQGSYELDFVLKYKDLLKIENGLSIEYYYNDEKKVYHSDFYLPDYNLIVEIKSYYWYKIHEKRCKVKEEYVKKLHNYIMILDKNYTEFDTIIKNIKTN